MLAGWERVVGSGVRSEVRSVFWEIPLPSSEVEKDVAGYYRAFIFR
jgi:hypothetical protein